MYLPGTFVAALILMLVSMMCWGSWANTMKFCPKFRFQLFYWDYALGLLAGTIVWGFSFGTLGSAGPGFVADLMRTPAGAIVLAALGGVVFNVANLLLVAAIDVAGLAVAFPVGIGLALIVGAVSSYFVAPQGNPMLLFGGVALVMVAIVLDAAAYKKRESAQQTKLVNGSTRGIVLSLIAGVLMGSFYPLVAKSMSALPGEVQGPGPYAIAFFFAIGVLISTVPANLALMRWPLDGKPRVDGSAYWSAPLGWHLAGVLGGMIWCTGTVANFVASQAHMVGPAVSYSIGQGATMVSAFWGVFVWREFAGSSKIAHVLLALMFVFFLLGLGAVALAPLY
jgi:glucose uptake protein